MELSLKFNNLLLFDNLRDVTSISFFIDKMIQTNLKFANIIWKQMIIKNLDYLFLNVFTESKVSQKHSSNLSKRVKFLLVFNNNTRCNKINQVAAFRMDQYSLMSIHKFSSSAMLSECIILLDHLSREAELWTFETIS